jgi:hypothetical protein
VGGGGGYVPVLSFMLLLIWVSRLKDCELSREEAVRGISWMTINVKKELIVSEHGFRPWCIIIKS